MRTRALVAAVLCSGVLAVPAGAAEHVTVPGLPGAQNKEAVVQPGGALKQASCGRVLQGEPATRPARSSLVTAAPNAPVPGSPYAPYAGGGTAAYVAPPQPAGAYPAGPALVEASFLTLRGTVTGWERASITILDRNGRSRTVALARGVRLWDGLQKGDLVSLRVPLDGSGALGPAERVERPSAAAASAAMPSKFSQNAPASR